MLLSFKVQTQSGFEGNLKTYVKLMYQRRHYYCEYQDGVSTPWTKAKDDEISEILTFFGDNVNCVKLDGKNPRSRLMHALANIHSHRADYVSSKPVSSQTFEVMRNDRSYGDVPGYLITLKRENFWNPLNHWVIIPKKLDGKIHISPKTQWEIWGVPEDSYVNHPRAGFVFTENDQEYELDLLLLDSSAYQNLTKYLPQLCPIETK